MLSKMFNIITEKLKLINLKCIPFMLVVLFLTSLAYLLSIPIITDIENIHIQWAFICIIFSVWGLAICIIWAVFYGRMGSDS